MPPEAERPAREHSPPERAPLRAVEAQARGEGLPPGARTLLVPMFEARERLDGFLVRQANDPDRSRSEWQKLVGAGAVLVNGRPSLPSKRLIPGERVTILAPPARRELDLPRAQDEVPFRVLYADPAMIVLDKPAGVVVHPAPGNAEGTLVNGLLARFPELRDQTGDQRPGIVHRLDKDTSGVMVVGRTAAAVAHLQRQMQARQTEKRYLALVSGAIAEDEGLIDRPIARDPRDRKRMAVRAEGRPSQTRFWVRERLGDWTLLEAQLLTGRTHQVRVHFASIHRPLAGDRTYGPGRAPAGVRRHFLHACALRLRSPHDGQERTFTADLPPDLAEPLAALRRRGARPS